ncbi:hypothetical protein D1872_340930 [compost metagenome]
MDRLHRPRHDTGRTADFFQFVADFVGPHIAGNASEHGVFRTKQAAAKRLGSSGVKEVGFRLPQPYKPVHHADLIAW